MSNPGDAKFQAILTSMLSSIQTVWFKHTGENLDAHDKAMIELSLEEALPLLPEELEESEI